MKYLNDLNDLIEAMIEMEELLSTVKTFTPLQSLNLATDIDEMNRCFHVEKHFNEATDGVHSNIWFVDRLMKMNDTIYRIYESIFIK